MEKLKHGEAEYLSTEANKWQKQYLKLASLSSRFLCDYLLGEMVVMLSETVLVASERSMLLLSLLSDKGNKIVFDCNEATLPQPPARGEGLEVELIISDQWFNPPSLCNKACTKTPQ